MMHFKSAVRSLVAFNTATKTIVNTTRNCRINYVCKLFFSSIPTHAGSAMPTLSPVSLTFLWGYFLLLAISYIFHTMDMDLFMATITVHDLSLQCVCLFY